MFWNKDHDVDDDDKDDKWDLSWPPQWSQETRGSHSNEHSNENVPEQGSDRQRVAGQLTTHNSPESGWDGFEKKEVQI